MQQTGKVKAWRDDKGYGFVTPDSGSRDFFVHVSVVDRDLGRDYLTLGERVEFNTNIGKRSGKEEISAISEAA